VVGNIDILVIKRYIFTMKNKKSLLLIIIFALVLFGRLSTPIDYALNLINIDITDRLITKIIWIPIVALIIGVWTVIEAKKVGLKSFLKKLQIKHAILAITSVLLIVFSMNPLETLQGLIYYSILVAFAVFVANNINKKFFKKFAISIIILNTILLLTALIQIYAFNLYGDASPIIQFFNQYGGFMPISFFTITENGINYIRPSAFLVDPNFLGIYMATSIVLILSIKFNKILKVLGVIVAGITIILTGSRTAFLMAVVGLLILCVYFTFSYIRDRKRRLNGNNQSQRANKRLLSIPFITSFEKIIERSLEAIKLQDTSTMERVRYLEGAIKAFLDYPLFGVGIGNYGLYFSGLENLEGGQTNPHNLYARILSETGIVGTLVFLYFAQDFIRKIFKTKNIFYITLIIITLIGNTFYDFMMTPWMWFYMGIMYYGYKRLSATKRKA